MSELLSFLRPKPQGCASCAEIVAEPPADATQAGTLEVDCLCGVRWTWWCPNGPWVPNSL